MNCNEVTSNLDLYVDSELPFAEMEAARAHMDCCPECAEKRQTEAVFRDLLRSRMPKRTCTECMREEVRHLVLDSELV